MKKLLLFVLALALLSSLTFAAPKTVELKLGFWGSSGEEKAYAKAIEGIEKAVPGVKISFQHYPSDKDFWDNLPGQIAAKSAPDMIVVTNENYMQYISNGLFAPLGNVKLQDISKSAINIWTVKGKLYGVPITAAPAAFIINMDMWKAAGLKDLPKTWNDVKAAAKVLTKGDVKGLCIADHQYHLTQYALSFGGGWGQGRTINTAGNIKGLQFAIDMFKEGLAITPKQAGLGWDGEVFGKGKCAMSAGGTWYVGFLKEAAPNINYEIIPIPKGTVNACTMHSYAFVVLKDAVNKDLAAKACTYMARADFQAANAELTGAMPSNVKVLSTFFDKNPKLKNLQQAVVYSKSFGYPAESDRFANDLVAGFDEIIYDNNSQKTAKDILSTLQASFK